MAFEMHAVPSGDFDGWIAAARNSGPVLDAASYAQLTQQSQDVQPFTFKSVQPRLFEAIVAQLLAPGPGPDIGKPKSAVSPRMRH